MFIGSVSTKNVGQSWVIEIVTVPNYMTITKLVILCTGHLIGAVYCTNAARGAWNHPLDVNVLDMGTTYDYLPNPLQKNWIQAIVTPFYAIPLYWYQDYMINLHYQNVLFKYQTKFRPRHPDRPIKVFHFRQPKLVMQIQVSTVAVHIQWGTCDLKSIH